MDIAYFDCRGGLSASAALAALRQAAPDTPESAGGSPAGTIPAALGGLPCPEEERKAVYDFGCLLTALGAPALYFSPLPLGRLADGAAGLLSGLAVQGDGGPVTAAGAVLARTLGRGSAPPPFVLRATGTGRGQGALVRVHLGDAQDPAGEEVAVLEANLDDFNPEFYPHLVGLLLAAGALDVFLTPVIMKKGRPGTVITVLAPPEEWRKQARLILAETSSLGVRVRREKRLTCPRRMITVDTPYGTVRAKVAESPDGRRKVKPEYEDCRKAAVASGLPLAVVYRTALTEAWRRVEQEGP